MQKNILSIIEPLGISRKALCQEKALHGVLHPISAMRYLRGECDTSATKYQKILDAAHALAGRTVETAQGQGVVCLRHAESGVTALVVVRNRAIFKVNRKTEKAAIAAAVALALKGVANDPRA